MVKRRRMFSVSALSTFDECRAKFNWSYRSKLELPGVSVARDVGSVFHRGLELWYRSAPTGVIPLGTKEDGIVQLLWTEYEELRKTTFFSAADEEKLLGVYVVGIGMLRAYWEHYRDKDKAWKVLGTEEPYRLPINGAMLHGYVDLVVEKQGEVWVVEHKTKSKQTAEDLGSIPFSPQAAMYPLGMRRKFGPIRGVLYNIVVRPGFRQKQGETREGFWQRCVDAYKAAPDEYFKRQPFLLDTLQCSRVKSELKKKCNDVERAITERRLYRNYNACYKWGDVCPFIDLCLNGRKPELLSRFQKRKSQTLKGV